MAARQPVTSWSSPSQGGQGLAFLILEDPQRLAMGGTVHPESSNVHAPTPGCSPHLLQAGEVDTLEEALPDMLDTPLNVRLVPGMSHPGRG